MAAAATACDDGGRETAATTTEATAPERTVSPPDERNQPVVAVVVADIACAPQQRATDETCQMHATADVARQLQPDVVLIPGDLQYPDGRLEYFRESFDATWGQFADIRPVPGNHEYQGGEAAGYFAYFADRDMVPGVVPPPGWYSHRLGQWQAFALNSVCWAVGGCGLDSPQVGWLQGELAAKTSTCEVAYWHHPRFSSGRHGSDDSVAAFWEVLHRAGVEIVLNGHEHLYERFAPQDAAGQPTSDGIRQFTVGTGGRSLYDVEDAEANSEVRIAERFGVLELSFEPGGYSWRFVAAPDGAVLDSGRGECR